MNLIALTTSRWGPSLIMRLCRVLPCGVARRLARWITSTLARRVDLPFIQALRANQAVVHGLPSDRRRVAAAEQWLMPITVWPG